MDQGQEHKDLKRLTNEEDEEVALALADALRQDDAEKFLQLYDEIPACVSPERLSNIKEMARQVAALTRTSSYRHGPMLGKDSTFFGINHPLQTTQLTLGNGALGSTDFSAFKTPPEGCTPVDSKQFDYEEETVRTFGVDCSNSLPFTALIHDGNNQLDDSGILQMDGLLDIPDLSETLKYEKHCRTNDVDATKADDDAFHTPPEFQEYDNVNPPFGYPPSSDKLIMSALNLLSKTSTENLEENPIDDTTEIATQKECESFGDLVEELTCSNIKNVNSEKDSLDGSPSSQNSFIQEEDDSGISTVEENDVSRDSPTTLNDNNSGDGKMKDNFNQRVYSKSLTTLEKRTSSFEPSYTCSNFHDAEDAGIGWQTRYKRISRKPNPKNDRRSNFCDREGYGQNGRIDSRDFPQRGFREVKVKVGNGKMEKNKRPGNRYPEDSERNKEVNVWTNKKNGEDSEIFELPSPKRSGRRGGSLPYGGKKPEGRWAKDGSREKHGEGENNGHALGSNSSAATQSSVFSYRDALLKASSKGSKDESPQQLFTSKTERVEFDLHSAANYLSSEWININNLYKKDPSKVFIYSDD